MKSFLLYVVNFVLNYYFYVNAKEKCQGKPNRKPKYWKRYLMFSWTRKMKLNYSFICLPHYQLLYTMDLIFRISYIFQGFHKTEILAVNVFDTFDCWTLPVKDSNYSKNKIDCTFLHMFAYKDVFSLWRWNDGLGKRFHPRQRVVKFQMNFRHVLKLLSYSFLYADLLNYLCICCFVEFTKCVYK